ncbi:MAG: HNH endonuclease [Gammaproteobacteria bacterium]
MSIKEAASMFIYNNGKLFWKSSDKEAGSLNDDGYIRVQVKNVRYAAHRLIFFMHYGYFPRVLDHINGIKFDNRIENLRPANHCKNGMNQGLNVSNTSGYKNVFRQNNKWCVRLKINGKNTWFGSYDDIELAGLVATEARNKHHKEFANHATSR